MSLKNVSIFIGSVNDEVVKIPLGGVDYTAPTVNALVTGHSTVFSLVTNPNGQTDLAFQMDDSIPYIIGDFKEASTTNPYSLATADYIGGQPKTRCPQCP